MFFSRGFSLVEMMIVFGLATLLAGITLPVGFRYYQTQLLDETTLLVEDSLRLAEQQALFEYLGSSFGVFVKTGELVVFTGDSYAMRDQSKDEVYSIDQGVNISGLTEVVFEKRTGLPTIGGQFTISSGSLEEIIIVDLFSGVHKQ